VSIVHPPRFIDVGPGIAVPAAYGRDVDCLNRLLRSAVAANPRARLLDLDAYICPHGTCRTTLDGVALRGDGRHFQGPAREPRRRVDAAASARAGRWRHDPDDRLIAGGVRVGRRLPWRGHEDVRSIMSDASSEHYTIISADCHAGGSHAMYREYLDPAYRDDFDAWREKYKNPFRDLQDGGRVRNWDDDRRIGDLEQDGIVGEVVFPNTVPPFFPNFVLFARPPKPSEYEHRLAGIRAHNRWLADFCGRHAERRPGSARSS